MSRGLSAITSTCIRGQIGRGAIQSEERTMSEIQEENMPQAIIGGSKSHRRKTERDKINLFV